jgi:hypothetical protein
MGISQNEVLDKQEILGCNPNRYKADSPRHLKVSIKIIQLNEGVSRECSPTLFIKWLWLLSTNLFP